MCPGTQFKFNIQIVCPRQRCKWMKTTIFILITQDIQKSTFVQWPEIGLQKSNFVCQCYWVGIRWSFLATKQACALIHYHCDRLYYAKIKVSRIISTVFHSLVSPVSFFARRRYQKAHLFLLLATLVTFTVSLLWNQNCHCIVFW